MDLSPDHPRPLQAVERARLVEEFERHLNDEEHPDYAKWLAQLIAPGALSEERVPRLPSEMKREPSA